jgi:hypothetical protein
VKTIYVKNWFVNIFNFVNLFGMCWCQLFKWSVFSILPIYSNVWSTNNWAGRWILNLWFTKASNFSLVATFYTYVCLKHVVELHVSNQKILLCLLWIKHFDFWILTWDLCIIPLGLFLRSFEYFQMFNF